MDWGMISPKMTVYPSAYVKKCRGLKMLPIKTVLPSTAGHPPPRERSSTMGRVSLVITFPSSKVTKTQCLPLFNKRRTLAACFFSLPSPDFSMTCRYISSYTHSHISASLYRKRFDQCLLDPSKQLSVPRMLRQEERAQLRRQDRSRGPDCRPASAVPHRLPGQRCGSKGTRFSPEQLL